ncbi:CRISPR-associated endonuclease Cas3'' [Desulfurococcaceae archaeon AG1]|nr:CRISPR-associated endonuclease Cas3'' [Desulfurococcaceae archaeon AG1]
MTKKPGCYAYKKGERAENLAEHLAGVARCCREHKLLAPVASKIARNYGLSKDYVEDMIVAACLLHDIGKADRKYQDLCLSSGCEEFSGHDVRGYKLAATALKRLEDSSRIAVNTGMADVLNIALLIPILMHHYFQRGIDNLRNDLDIIDEIDVHPQCIEDLHMVLELRTELFKNEYVENLVSTVLGLITDGRVRLVPVYRFASVPDLLNDLQSYTNLLQKHSAIAVTAILNECDGWVARVRRG